MRINKHHVRHEILEDMLFYGIANNLAPLSYLSYKEIEQLKSDHKKRRFAINYLIAKGDIQNLETGFVINIRLTKQGEQSYYSEQYKEIGNIQVANFLKNALTFTLSIVVAIAAVIALRGNDNEKEKLKSEPQLQQQIDSLKQQIDSIKILLSARPLIQDSSLNKR